MSLRYLNVPGVEFVTIDDLMVPVQGGSPTESVLIIGPSLDGPNDQVIPLRADPIGIYGGLKFSSQYPGPSGETDGYSGNALVKAIREAQAGGARDIRCLRVGGSKATGTLTMAAVNNSGLSGTVTMLAKNPGHLYDSVAVAFTSGATSASVTVTQPTVKGGAFTYSWSGGSSGLTVAQVLDKINSHSKNSTVILSLGTINNGVARILNGTVTLDGGTDGTIKDDNSSNKTAMYSAYTVADTGAFAILADYECDLVALAGIFLDDLVVSADSTRSIAQDFATYLAKRTLDHPMTGVIAVRPLDKEPTRANIDDHYDALVNQTAGTRTGDSNWLNAGYFMVNGFSYSDGSLEQVIDSGAYLSIVTEDAYYSDTELGLYRECSAAHYAGIIAAEPPHRALTNRLATGIARPVYTFTKAQLDVLAGGIGANTSTGELGGGAYVALVNRQGRGVFYCQDVTSAMRRSGFRNLQPIRIANAVHKGIKEIAFPYLGGSNDPPTRLALRTQLRSLLDGFWEAGALAGKEGIGYEVEVLGSSSALTSRLGTLVINVALRTAPQIKQIVVRVRMSYA